MQMDDATRLVSELQNRLAELDGKVAAYQKQMLNEFQKHMDESLRDYPADVSTLVSRVIAESMSNYPSLNRPPAQSPNRDADGKFWDGRRSPPPILYHTSGTPKDGPRSPHEREKEFQGVFTPSYLPLLDSIDRPLHSPPTSPHTPTLTLPQPLLEVISKADDPPAPVKQDVPAAIRPPPPRRLTDNSIESSGSETKGRRSALRRTSSSTKGSPRRVRFEFQGVEVLPSSSPQAAVVLGELDTEQAETNASAIITEDESPDYTGTSLLDVEGEEDSLPRPKKVSSTQALRALSRSPLDEGTVWTVVNPDIEEAPQSNTKDEGNTMSRSNVSQAPVAKTNTELNLPPGPEDKSTTTAEPKSAGRDGASHPPLGSGATNQEEEDGSDEEFLSMRPKNIRKSASPATRSPLSRSPAAGNLITVATEGGPEVQTEQPKVAQVHALLTPDKAAVRHSNDEDEDMFDFDEDGDKPLDRNTAPPLKYLEEEEDVEPEPQVETVSPTTVTASATSPPRTILNALPAPMSPTSAMFTHSIGSYKGNPMRITPINNPELYDEISNMKDVPFFVGSVDGRSGVEAADLGSYRASLSKALTGATPRSFTERLALEEAMEKGREDDEEPSLTRRTGI